MVGAAAAAALAAIGAVMTLIQPVGLSSIAPAPRHPLAPLGALPLQFVENRGQADPRVRYSAQTSGFSVYFGADEARLVLGRRTRVSLDLRFLGANGGAHISAQRPTSTHFNYLRGSDPTRWQHDLPGYRQIAYSSLWPGIDMRFRGDTGRLKYELIVAPRADPRAIQLTYAGAQSLGVGTTGNLLIRTSRGALEDARPVAYQVVHGRAVAVRSGYLLRGGTHYGFAVGRYNRDKPLVIDPGIAYSTFLGGAASEDGTAVAVDSSGSAYVTGDSASTDFTMTPGATDTSQNGSYDVFVAKLNTTGSGLSYATFIGGSGVDQGFGIAVDAARQRELHPAAPQGHRALRMQPAAFRPPGDWSGGLGC